MPPCRGPNGGETATAVKPLIDRYRVASYSWDGTATAAPTMFHWHPTTTTTALGWAGLIVATIGQHISFTQN